MGFQQLTAALVLLCKPAMTLPKSLACLLGAGLVGAIFLDHIPRAYACGCFTPPDPSVPIVQAGERIVFAVEDGVVTAHIQIQYSGAAEDFGWLLPLPSLPELQVGTDELFAAVTTATQPKYVLDAQYRGDCAFDPSRGSFGGRGEGTSAPGSESDDGGGGSPLVVEDTVGPYDYAVLRADSKQPMLDWLAENRYFVPAGTDDVVDPYIRQGAYFLALKLRKGNDVGDLQPVIVTYASDLPMIPIVLTSVAADPNMGIQVWVLGNARAIPRNYFHTVVNDAQIDWINFGQNYVDVVTRAVDESDDHHSFVTEYAGTSQIMVDVLDPPGRFGDLTVLAGIQDAVDYIDYLNATGFSVFTNAPPFGQAYTSQALNILQKYLPVPSALAGQGVTPNEYYINFRYFIDYDRLQNPALYTDLDLEFDPVALTAELDERVVGPTRAAGLLFRNHPYMTRMFTTLSPEEMSEDPVFSFNPDLGDYSNEHRGTITYYCYGEPLPQSETPASIITEAGFKLNLPNGTADNPWSEVEMPSSQYQHVIREEGAEIVVLDNTDKILAALRAQNGGGGCSLALRRSPSSPWSLAPLGLALFGLAVMSTRRRR
jgi:hypothetical protein